MENATEVRSGGCRCGAVRYELRGGPLGGIACHCRDCQYVSGGSPNLSWVFDRSGFGITKGVPAEYKAGSGSGGTNFCSTCGVQIFSVPDSNRNLVAIKVGSLDDPAGFAVDADMWMKSAPPWHRPHDGAAQYDHNIPTGN